MVVTHLWLELVNTHVFIPDGESYLFDLETHVVGRTGLTTAFTIIVIIIIMLFKQECQRTSYILKAFYATK